MTDRIVHAEDLDGARGLSEDGKAFVKVDGSSIIFDSAGALKSLASFSEVSIDPNSPAIGSAWILKSGIEAPIGVITGGSTMGRLVTTQVGLSGTSFQLSVNTSDGVKRIGLI